jgi:iron complex transport system permease protein
MKAGQRPLVIPLFLGVIACAVLSLLVGPVLLSPSLVFKGLVGADPSAAIIVQEIRLPRMLLSLSVGGILGLCGAAAQSLARNPLAEPAVFGTPQAAALGAVLVLYTGAAPALSIWLPLAAITSALISMVFIVWLLRNNQTIVTMLLAGIGIGSLAGAATSLVISFSNNPFAIMEIVFWMMGSFEDRSMQHVYLVFPFFMVSCLLIFSCGSGYKALTLGEDVAYSLGIDVNRIALLTILAIALGVGAGVAACGAIGFIGLVSPHMVRPFCGGSPSRLLLPAALVGAVLTTTADIAVRLLPSNGELRVGVLTAFIGVPWFIYLVASNRGSTGVLD